jgi:ribonuclease HI
MTPSGRPAHSQSDSPAEIIAYIDGASRGNPGPASYGVVIQDAVGNPLNTLSQHIGEATNNVAEYRALVAALEYASSRNVRSIKIFCDSELVARQMQGRYRVQSPDLLPLFQRASALSRGIGQFSIQHVPREKNREADQLANAALDRNSRKTLSPQNQEKLADAGPKAHSPGVEFLTVCAVVEGGKLRLLGTLPDLEEGAEYDVRISKRAPNPKGRT